MRLFRTHGSPAANLRLEGPRVVLRPAVERDWRPYAELRAASRAFLEPWEPTWPPDALTRDTFHRRMARNGVDWRDDAGYAFLIFAHDGAALLGGITLSNVRRGVAQTGTLGYWIGEPHAGRGYMGEALDQILAFAFDQLSLHRVEAACLPSNEPSQRLLRRRGFAQEGYARRYLKIRGEWHDHLLFALLVDDYRYGNLDAANSPG